MSKPSNVKTPTVGSAVSGAAVCGMVAGGTAAAARSIRQVREGSMTRQQAVGRVLREAGSTGLASGVAVGVVGGLGLGGLLSLMGVAVVATGTKYALDSVINGPQQAQAVAGTDAAPAEEKPAPSKPAPKSTAKASTKTAARTSSKAASKPAASDVE